MSDFTLIIKSDEPKRRKLKVNITRLSYTTGYNKSHISRVFAGETRPSVRCLEKLAKALGITLGDLHTAIDKGEMDVNKTR